MKQKHLLTMMVAFALLMLSACSSDDSQNAKSEKMAVLRPLDVAANELNQNLEGLDFKELDPLAEAITSGTRADGEGSEFDVKLSTLLSLLEGDEGKGVTLGRRFSYDAFNTALELAYDLSVILKDNGESSSSWFGLKADGRGEITYTARNGQQYHISAEMEKDISIYRWNFYVTGASQFYIYKGDELVLRLLSNTERNRPVWLPLLIRGNSFTGELLYRDYVVTLDYRQLHTHERSVVLTYGKSADESPLLVMNTTLTDDADILKLIKHDVTVEADFTVSAMDGLFVFSGHSSNVNYLVVNGVKIAKCMQEGTTEEECQQLVADFNDNLKLSLLVQTTSFGDLFMGIVRDSATGRSYPTVMVNLPSDDEAIPLTTILDKLGIDIPNILQTVAQFDE
jgi:hypothetical protein